MSEQLTDQVLVERVQQGDKQAFNLLVGRYQTKVCNLIARYLNNPSDVPDVAQEVFIKAYRSIGSFRGESAFYTWLYRVAVNTSKNHITSAGRKPPATDVDAADAENFELGSNLREITNPENLTLSNELKQHIFAAVAELPDDLKTAITLREIEGLSYEEIAHVMECPVGTVRSRIFRARDAVDKRIQPLMERI
jgi:RNA polymerase sigma-70 factor (ECF subfamily)